MVDQESYETQSLAAAAAAIAKGYSDPANLRQLLIWTTATTTSAMVDSYFKQHHDDAELLAALIPIALEGEDNGDAPWAAANTIADFPATMLVLHRAALQALSTHPWSYLSEPARGAIAKIDAIAT